MKNGKEVIVDAKKAAAILGQGSAIHEEARQLKVERAEFEEYLTDVRSRQEGLALAMEFTVQPKLQKAYDEILKTQSYQTTFEQQLAQTRDPAQVARIQASMAQNEQYIRQQQKQIGKLKPAIDEFRHVRTQQVQQYLDNAFTDKELKNEFVFNELRDKLTKLWPSAKNEILPGIPNIDLISSDENLLSLVRDGLRYRDKPSTKSAGASMAALTGRKGSSNQRGSGDSDISKLREQAKSGDKKAADNLLVAQLQRLRAGRGGR
jgi:predicted acetyltransferase